jgi:hypothetical protein
MVTNWVAVLHVSIIASTKHPRPIRMTLNLLRNIPRIFLKAAGPSRLRGPAQGAALLTGDRGELKPTPRQVREGALALPAQI